MILAEKDWLQGLSGQRVAVLGDLILDQYWGGDVNRISPEAPVPVVRVSDSNSFLGGAANVAANAVDLGAKVDLYSVVGEDTPGDDAMLMLKQRQLDSCVRRSSDISTTYKLRVLGMSQQLIRLDFEKPQNTDCVDALIQELIDNIHSYDLLILSDYSKGVLTSPQRVIQAARQHGVPVYVDTKSTNLALFDGVTLYKPNRAEFEKVAGFSVDYDDMESKAQAILNKHNITSMLITLGKDGMLFVSKGAPAVHTKSSAKEVFDVTGAGDTVIATLAVMRLSGMDWPNSISIANQAAGVVIEELGTATITIERLRAASLPFSPICSLPVLLDRIRIMRESGKKLVMTNGCFDILHAGHVEYLNSARELGDCLLVAVNTDESVQQLKGPTRPINPLSDRLSVLSGLRAVDCLIAFSEETPAELIKQIQPDVLVKAADYAVSEIAGADFVLSSGGEVRTIPLKEGKSTTGIVQRIMDSQRKHVT